LKKNSEPHTGARPSVRLCVGPELARCVHIKGDLKTAGLGVGLSAVSVLPRATVVFLEVVVDIFHCSEAAPKRGSIWPSRRGPVE
jgi:hypothetical protein